MGMLQLLFPSMCRVEKDLQSSTETFFRHWLLCTSHPFQWELPGGFCPKSLGKVFACLSGKPQNKLGVEIRRAEFESPIGCNCFTN